MLKEVFARSLVVSLPCTYISLCTKQVLKSLIKENKREYFS